MGHLTRIANAVVQSLEGGPLQSQVSQVFRGERLQARCRCPGCPLQRGLQRGDWPCCWTVSLPPTG